LGDDGDDDGDDDDDNDDGDGSKRTRRVLKWRNWTRSARISADLTAEIWDRRPCAFHPPSTSPA
jgi:hypothetical protein